MDSVNAPQLSTCAFTPWEDVQDKTQISSRCDQGYAMSISTNVYTKIICLPPTNFLDIFFCIFGGSFVSSLRSEVHAVAESLSFKNNNRGLIKKYQD